MYGFTEISCGAIVIYRSLKGCKMFDALKQKLRILKYKYVKGPLYRLSQRAGPELVDPSGCEFQFDPQLLLQDLEQWGVEYDSFDGYKVKELGIGTVFGLTPSGKFYMPFACSNVDGCPVCNWAGRVKPRNLILRIAGRSYWHTCPVCHGLGSLEALKDEIWRENAEREMESVGLGIGGSEGDSTCIVVTRYIEEDEDD